MKRTIDRSIHQRVSNVASERNLSRDDAFVAYLMDRLLYRLGRSSESGEFFLKGGVLVANLIEEPYRFTRDIDFLRRQGPPDPEEIRTRFERVVAVLVDDGIVFEKVRAVAAERDVDEYDGVKVFVLASVARHTVELRMDIGFGDAVEPQARRMRLVPFLENDPPANVHAYLVGSVIAEKVQTVLGKFPAIEHRLKDILDVVALSDRLALEGDELIPALQATFERRATPVNLEVLEDLFLVLQGRKWEREWAMMRKNKAVLSSHTLAEAVVRFDRFVRPLLAAMVGQGHPSFWSPGGPWTMP